MKAKLPTCKSEVVDGKVQYEYGEIVVGFDLSIWAEERWEENFPNNAKSETLMNYIKRVTTIKVEEIGSILSYLKPLYCLIEDGEFDSFRTFCKMFDLSNIKYTQDLLTKVFEFLKIALSSSMVDEKN